MKKIYLKPELEEVIILHKQSLLAGSPDVKDGDVTDINDLLAPELEPGIENEFVPILQ
jgi:hypothetical protein